LASLELPFYLASNYAGRLTDIKNKTPGSERDQQNRLPVLRPIALQKKKGA
jgi:hypothetical protein